MVASHKTLNVRFQQPDGTPMPATSDGKTIFLPNLFRGDVDINYAGAGDTGTTGRGDGSAFLLSQSVQGDMSVTWSFADWVYIAGGVLSHSGAKLGDHATFSVFAPATTVAVNGGGAGNCNLAPTGLGFNLIVPAAGNGTHDVTGAVPVPAQKGDGYWNWDDPDEGKGAVTPSVTPGAAKFQLYDVQIPLTQWVTKVHMLGSGKLDFKVAAIKPKKLLPHWTLQTTLHNVDGTHTVECVWHLMCGRKKTT